MIGYHDSHSASAALVASDGRPLYASAEERFSKRKLQKGYPSGAIADLRRRFDVLDSQVCYVDLPLGAKVSRNAELVWNSWAKRLNCEKSAGALVGTLSRRVANGQVDGIVGVDEAPKNGGGEPGRHDGGESGRNDGREFVRNSDAKIGYDSLCEHHTAHAASAYYPSGFEDAVVLTIDGVGDCLSGCIFEGRAGRLTLQKKFYYNELTVGADYETFTAMMGFNPDRHCGKITGLAACGRHNQVCISTLDAFLSDSWRRGNRNFFDRMHGVEADATIAELRGFRDSRFGAFSREDLSYAMQHLAEERVLSLIREHISDVRGRDIALAGGVFANVRINQKIKQLGFRRIFIQPAMDDGGLAFGAALHHLSETAPPLSGTAPLRPMRMENAFLGPGFDDDHIRECLDLTGVRYERVGNIAYAVAKLIAAGKVVGRFDGRMEFGPRALGNRSILCDTRDPTINDWLNQRLQRTEFMPFAPATLLEHAEQCYTEIEGCEHAAEFMTITFDCTNFMREMSPAVVHIDGTARAQFVREGSNPGLHEIVSEYVKLTGIPSVLNTSFNMHESPIIATPEDAIQTFRDGRLDYLAIGPFLANAKNLSKRRQNATQGSSKSMAAAC